MLMSMCKPVLPIFRWICHYQAKQVLPATSLLTLLASEAHSLKDLVPFFFSCFKALYILNWTCLRPPFRSLYYPSLPFTQVQPVWFPLLRFSPLAEHSTHTHAGPTLDPWNRISERLWFSKGAQCAHSIFSAGVFQHPLLPRMCPHDPGDLETPTTPPENGHLSSVKSQTISGLTDHS